MACFFLLSVFISRYNAVIVTLSTVLPHAALSVTDFGEIQDGNRMSERGSYNTKPPAGGPGAVTMQQIIILSQEIGSKSFESRCFYTGP